jgi:hypothetical protein
MGEGGQDFRGQAGLTRRRLIVLSAILLASFSTASAQPSFPCSLVCFPPAHLNAKKCACEESVPRKPVCSLVCLEPDQTLDVRKCACIRRTH